MERAPVTTWPGHAADAPLGEAMERALRSRWLCDRARSAAERSRGLVVTAEATCARSHEAQQARASARRSIQRPFPTVAPPWTGATRKRAPHSPRGRPAPGRVVQAPSATAGDRATGERVVRRAVARRQSASRDAAPGDGGDALQPRVTSRASGPAPAVPAVHDDLPPSWACAFVLEQRDIVDREGRPWTVRELDGTVVPGSRGARCLVVETHGAVRRFWRYPADWATLDDAALLRLCGVTS